MYRTNFRLTVIATVLGAAMISAQTGASGFTNADTAAAKTER